jgi:hypothetical protein
MKLHSWHSVLMGMFLVLQAPLNHALMATPDTLDVAPLPRGNINTVINGDTITGGVRAHPDRVYRLQREGIYEAIIPIRVHGPLHIIATEGTGRPPVVQVAAILGRPELLFEFTGNGADVEISNVFIRSNIPGGSAGSGLNNGIVVGADSVRLQLHGVIFDGFTGIAIALYGQWPSLDVRDCTFRNLQHPTSWFSGQACFAANGVHWDRSTFVNNTFFACNSYILTVQGYNRELLFEHNTIVYGVVNPFVLGRATNITIRNNIFYGLHAFGGVPDQVINGWFLNFPDTASSSLIMLRGYDEASTWCDLWGGVPLHGPEMYEDPAHGVTSSMVDPSQRSIEITNNAYFWPPRYFDFVDAYNDTVQHEDSVDVPVYGLAETRRVALRRKLYLPEWMNAYTRWTLDSLLPAASAQVMVSGNEFANPCFIEDIEDHLDPLLSYVSSLYTPGWSNDTWHYRPDLSLPKIWPLPENLMYSNGEMQTAGSDGFPLGDLNWFPEQKAEWLLQNPLPVQLVDLRCSLMGSHVVGLSWRTLSETNNFGFWVQRRRTGDQVFADVAGGFIPGNGTTVQAHAYAFVDSTIGSDGDHLYRLKQMDLDGAVHYSDAITVRMTLSGVDGPVTERFALMQNFPNPFNPATIIRYQVPAPQHVRLAVYDALGREVAVLVDANRDAGIHEATFNCSGLPSGMYFYRMQAGSFTQTRSLVVVR